MVENEGGEHDYQDPVKLVIDHQDAIKQNFSDIDLVLEENLHRVDRVVRITPLNRAISNQLREQIQQDDEITALASAIIHVIRHYHQIENLDDIDDELRAWFKRCNIKYEAEIDESRAYDTLGPHAWTNMDTEVIINSESGAVNFHHSIKTVEGGTRFTSSTSGLVSMIHHLLNHLEEAAHHDVLIEEDIDAISEQVDDIVEVVKQSESRSEILRDILLSDIPISEENMDDYSEEELYDMLSEIREEE